MGGAHATAAAQAAVIRGKRIEGEHDPDPAVEMTSLALAYLPTAVARGSPRVRSSRRSPATPAIRSKNDSRPGLGSATSASSPAAHAEIINLGSRVDGVFTILHAEPDRAFTPTELAQTLEITNINSFDVQLANWVRRGRLGKTGRSRYTVPDDYPENGPLTRADQPQLRGTGSNLEWFAGPMHRDRTRS